MKKVQRKPFDTFRFIMRKILLVLLAAIVLFPVFYMISSSLFSASDFNNLRLLPSHPVWENYTKALNQKYFIRYMFNSIGTSLITAFLRTAIVILAAFAFTHLRFRGKSIVFAALVLTLFIPQEAILYQNYRTVAGMGLLDTWAGIISTSLFSAAQMLLLMGSFKIQGKEIYDAARIDGASDPKYILSILIPLSGPAILTVGIQTLIVSFNSYLWPLLVTNKNSSRTIQIGMTMLGFSESGQLGPQMATLVIVTVPFLLFLALAKKKIETTLIRR
ncbi:MAG: carbohydrate ABC transporter permease [Sphaerochaetaceae bacterium]|nr:carbohydrate ABC transporter permease [Sphaerochaetaceae bacterium]